VSRAALAAAGLALMLIAPHPVLSAPSHGPGALRPGMPAPEFVRADLHGKRIDLAQYRGKVVLVDFWATWCAPCLIEIPRLIDMQRRLGGAGLQVIGVSMDDSADPVRSLSHRYPFDYPIVMGDAKLGERYGGVLGLPVQFLVGRNGKIIRGWEGAIDPAALDAAVQQELTR
jgi:cytochrome c biogenesis protein CcmG/thiol:disulfide interchange protein DsbE